MESLVRDHTLRGLRVGAWVLLLAGIVLALVAVRVATDNPTIANTSRGDTYTCLAPWDTVLNDASNYPGGEPPPDGDDIADRCGRAGEERFATAAAAGIAAGAVVAMAGVVGLLYLRRDRRPRSGFVAS